MSHKSSLAAFCVWALLAATPWSAVAAGDEVFVDRFDRPNADRREFLSQQLQ